MRRVSKLIPILILVASLGVAEANASETKRTPQPPSLARAKALITQLLHKFGVTILDDMSVPKP